LFREEMSCFFPNTQQTRTHAFQHTEICGLHTARVDGGLQVVGGIKDVFYLGREGKQGEKDCGLRFFFFTDENYTGGMKNR